MGKQAKAIDTWSVDSEPLLKTGCPVREYRLATVGPARNLCKIHEPYSSTLLYTCEMPTFAFRRDDVTMHLGDSVSGPVVATSRITNWDQNIELFFASLPSQDLYERIPRVTRETMVRQRPLLKTNCFALPLAPPSSRERRQFVWKGTHHVKGGFWQKIDSTHVKLVDSATNDVVARFVHRAGCVGPANGTFEICRDLGGQGWDEMVLLSGISLMKFIGKMRSHNPW